MHMRTWVTALSFVLASATAFAQGPAPTPTDAEMEAFLRTARIVQVKNLDIGVTGSVRATLSDGTLTHDAHIQVVDAYKAEFRNAKGQLELNFRDNWRYNVAAYRLDRMLDLRLVPVSVERPWRGRHAAFTWWVDDVVMDEGKRMRKSLVAPDYGCFTRHAQALRMFDQLIENTDRNLGNTLYSSTWRMWAIDHTRAFRTSARPPDLTDLTSLDPALLDRMAALEFRALKKAIGRYVDGPQMRKLLSRRDALLAHYAALPADAMVTRPDPSLGCATTVKTSRPDLIETVVR